MRYLLLSVLVVCVIGVMIPSAFALHTLNEKPDFLQSPLTKYIPEEEPIVKKFQDGKIRKLNFSGGLIENDTCEIYDRGSTRQDHLEPRIYSVPCITKLFVMYDTAREFMSVSLIQFESNSQAIDAYNVENQAGLKQSLNLNSNYCSDGNTFGGKLYVIWCYKENYQFTIIQVDWDPRYASVFAERLFDNLPGGEKYDRQIPLSFVDPEKNPTYYVERYHNELEYKQWFHKNFPDYYFWDGIGISENTYNEIVQLIEFEKAKQPHETQTSSFEPEPEPTPKQTSSFEPEQTQQQSNGGGCLIATAAFGSEMAPQVQFLRELRDNTVLQTESGSAFMTGFNQFYYSFSPTIADYERENPTFKEAVKLTLTPLLASLTLLHYADIDSESEMLGYGIGIILLNIGMYFVAPAILIMKVKKRI